MCWQADYCQLVLNFHLGSSNFSSRCQEYGRIIHICCALIIVLIILTLTNQSWYVLLWWSWSYFKLQRKHTLLFSALYRPLRGRRATEQWCDVLNIFPHLRCVVKEFFLMHHLSSFFFASRCCKFIFPFWGGLLTPLDFEARTFPKHGLTSRLLCELRGF